MLLVEAGEHVRLLWLRLCLSEVSEAAHRLLLLLLALRGRIKSGRPLRLRLLRRLIRVHVVADVLLLLLHAVEKLRLEACTPCCSGLLLLHATERIVVLLHLSLHLHLHELLLFLLALLGCIEVIHVFKRCKLGGVRGRARAGVQHSEDVVQLVLLCRGLHILLWLLLLVRTLRYGHAVPALEVRETIISNSLLHWCCTNKVGELTIVL